MAVLYPLALGLSLVPRWRCPRAACLLSGTVLSRCLSHQQLGGLVSCHLHLWCPRSAWPLAGTLSSDQPSCCGKTSQERREGREEGDVCGPRSPGGISALVTPLTWLDCCPPHLPGLLCPQITRCVLGLPGALRPGCIPVL